MLIIDTKNIFTNDEELVYPTEDDNVDIKVLNNNTRLLAEQKLDANDLTGVAKEREEYSIEDKVNSIDEKIEALANEVAILKKTKDKFWNSKNIQFQQLYKDIKSGTSNSEVELFTINGSGKLAMLYFYDTSYNSQIENCTYSIRIEIDDTVIAKFLLDNFRIYKKGDKRCFGYIQKGIYIPHLRSISTLYTSQSLIPVSTNDITDLPYDYTYQYLADFSGNTYTHPTGPRMLTVQPDTYLYMSYVGLIDDFVKFDKNIRVVLENYTIPTGQSMLAYIYTNALYALDE